MPWLLDSAEAELAARAGAAVDDLQAFIGMVGVAEDAVAARDRARCARRCTRRWCGSARVVQSMRQRARGQTVKTRSPVSPQEGFVDDEFVVAVLVEAFQAGAVAADAVHARRGVAGELDPLADRADETADGSRCAETGWRASQSHRSGRPPGRIALPRLIRGGEPLAIAADGAFAQFGAWLFAIERSQACRRWMAHKPAAAREDQVIAVGM